MNQTPTAIARLLLQAWEYAQECGCDPWDFAVNIGDLRRAGLTANDLRYLLRKGYVRHALERTKPRDKRRLFTFRDGALIGKKSVFVLTPAGVEAARLFQPETTLMRPTPFYQQDARELWYDGLLVKAYRQPAPDQHFILTAFQEEQWPGRIDSPLSPHDFDEDQKLRLRRTVHRLNQHHLHQLIRFLADGRGEGIRWRPWHREAPEKRC